MLQDIFIVFVCVDTVTYSNVPSSNITVALKKKRNII